MSKRLRSNGMIQKRGILLVFIVLCLLLNIHVVFAATGFTNDLALHFTGDSNSIGTVYQDGVGGNLDVGIELCDNGQRHVGAFYALNVGGTWEYVPISYSSSSEALSFTTQAASGSCFNTLPGFLTVSPSQLTTPDPDIQKAAFPGRLYIGHSASSNPGTVSDFEYAGSNAQLEGSYSIPRSFNQNTLNLEFTSAPTTTYQTQSSSFSKSLTDAAFGVSSDRQVVIGVCSDDHGESCSSGSAYSSVSFPLALSTGLGSVSDQQTFTRYAVINGNGAEVCIGANLRGIVSTVTPDPVYYSQNLTLGFTILNSRASNDVSGGNVDVTTDFEVLVEIFPQGDPSNITFNTTLSISDTIGPSSSVIRNVIWPAFALSGFYQVRVTVDSGNDIVECLENDNTDTDTFELKPITIPRILIDGDETSEFDFPNVPYTVEFNLENSDGLILSDATVNLIEENGLNILVPPQLYNHTTGSGTEVRGSTSFLRNTFLTDINGSANLTVIPAYNGFFDSQYSSLGFESAVGGYALYFTGTQSDDEDFVFVENGVLSSTFNFTFINTSYPSQTPDKNIANEPFAAQAMDFIYRTFVQFVEALT